MRHQVTLVMVAALLGLTAASDAQTTRLTITTGQEAASLKAQGWAAVSEGLWERTTLDGRKETFVSGAAGLENILPALRRQVEDAQQVFAHNPSPANKRALDARTQLVAAVEANLLSAAAAGASSENAAAPACTRNFSYGATVNHPGRCINQAYASASYSTNNATACPEQCTVQTYAYASAQCGSDPATVETENCGQTGTNVSCSSLAWSQWGSSCYQYASASIHCPQLNNLYLSQTANDSICLCGCF